MSILRIRTIGDPVLRTPAQEVTQFDDALAALVRDMIETMYAVVTRLRSSDASE